MERSKLEEEIIGLQRRINHDMRDHTLHAWMGLNLTIPQVKSLFFIAHRGTTNLTRLAASMGVTPSNVTGIVDRLVEQGLVNRYPNTEDRRELLLSVTDKGESKIADLRERRLSRISSILSHLSPEELEDVRRGLSLLVRATEIHNSEKDKEDISK